MADYNGSQFELGRLFSHLQIHMNRQTDILERMHEHSLVHWERQANAMEAIEQTLGLLPERIMGAMTGESQEVKPSGASLSEVTALIKALYPVLILTFAVFGKMTWPQALPVIREAMISLLSGA